MVEQFIQDRKYLKAVSPKTLIWYQCSFKAFDGATSSREALRLPPRLTQTVKTQYAVR
jgi:hypothetical protein